MKEFKNEILERLKFNMEEIKLFDSFAGIGALHNALKMLGVPVKIIGLSETDIDAIISYASIHINEFKDLEFDYPSEEKMKQWLIDRNIGWSFEKQKSAIHRLKKDKLYKVYKASVLLNNLGDISKIKYDEMDDFDLFNMSFPCTDISGAGRQKGFKNNDGTPTRSGLVKYSIELIKSKRPKYIMIENVKALIQKKFINDFYDICNEIESYGYRIYYPTKEDKNGNKVPTCLNAKNYGIPQNRERIFVICVRNNCKENIEHFWEGKDFGYRLKDFLEDEIDEKYYLSKEIQERFKLNGNEDSEHNELNIIGTSAPEYRTIGQRDTTYGTNGIMSTLTATDYKQPKQIIDNIPFTNNYGKIKEREDGICTCLDTRYSSFPDNHNQRTGIVEKNSFIDKKNREQQFERKENYIQWDTSGKGHNSQEDRAFYENKNLGTIPASLPQDKTKVVQGLNTKDFRIRKLTPKECWRLMGFTDEDFDNAKAMGTSDSALYKQAGNSIVVNCLYYIFRELFKNHIIKTE